MESVFNALTLQRRRRSASLYTDSPADSGSHPYRRDKLLDPAMAGVVSTTSNSLEPCYWDMPASGVIVPAIARTAMPHMPHGGVDEGIAFETSQLLSLESTAVRMLEDDQEAFHVGGFARSRDHIKLFRICQF